MAKQKQKQEQREAARQVQKETPRHEQVRQDLHEISHRVEDEYLDLSKLCHEVYSNSYHSQWGYENFSDYANTELPFGFRKAYQLVEIWDAFLRCDGQITEEDLREMGYSKAREVAKILNAENAKEWLEKSKELSMRTLIDQVKTVKRRLKGDGDEGGASITTFSLKLPDDDYRIIQDAIENTKGLLDEYSVTAAFVHICLEWMESQGSVPETTPLDKIVEWVERTYGVSLEVNYNEKDGRSEIADASKALEEAGVEKNGKKNGGKKKKEIRAPEPPEPPEPEETDESDEAPDPEETDESDKTEEDEVDINEILGLDG